MASRVNDIYKGIFDQDPLLLDENNQRIFGAQILENLLVERGIKSALPHPVILGSPSSRAAFRRSDEPTPGEVDEGLKRRYLQNLRTRKPHDADDVEKLKTVTMVSQPDSTREWADQASANHDEAAKEAEGTGSPLDKRIRIATIGYRVSISRLEGTGRLDEELCPMPPRRDGVSLNGLPENKDVQKLRRTTLRDHAKQPPWFEAVKMHLQHALDRQSHIIVLPEFGLPPNLTKQQVEQALSEVASNYNHTYLLFSGTRHEGVYNRGFVVSGRSNKDTPTDRWWHYKTASARGLGENVMGPQNARIPSYKFSLPSPIKNGDTLEYRVFVPICFDVFDPTTFINYVAGCADADGRFHQSIILVPSFNPGREFVHALRDLSFIASCPVIYVNGLHGDAKLFLYGIAVSDLARIEANTDDDQKRKRPDRSIDDAIRKLERDLAIAIMEYNELEGVIDYDPALHKSIESQRSRLSEKRHVLKARLEALREFSTDLDEIRSQGALKHLVTTEPCAQCGEEGHGGTSYCSKDILYYNLSPDLLGVLNTFRNKYFAAEDFLPSPFRSEGKRRIREMINEQNDRRQIAKARLSQRG